MGRALVGHDLASLGAAAPANTKASKLGTNTAQSQHAAYQCSFRARQGQGARALGVGGRVGTKCGVGARSGTAAVRGSRTRVPLLTKPVFPALSGGAWPGVVLTLRAQPAAGGRGSGGEWGRREGRLAEKVPVVLGHLQIRAEVEVDVAEVSVTAIV